MSCLPPACWRRACSPRSGGTAGSGCGSAGSDGGWWRRTATPRWRRRRCALGADDPTAQLLDTSLRQLSAALAAEGKTPPTVFAAHLGGEHLDLWVAPADPEPPGPWQAVDGGQVWRLPVAAALPSLDAGRARSRPTRAW